MLRFGQTVEMDPVAMAGGRADQALVKTAGAHDLLTFDAVLVGIQLKIKIVQESDDFPKIGFVAIAELVGIPAHHVADDMTVFEVKFALVELLQKFDCLLFV